MPTQSKPQGQFAKGDHVRLKRDRTKIGSIWDNPFFGERGWKYEVMVDSELRIFAEADLVPYDQDQETRFGDRNDLLRNLILLKLRQPLADNLYAAYASRTMFEVYQFKPALKFLNHPDQRLLIADEVGLGKTIEAGIILLELQARMDVARVLVICPSALRVKWRDEMRSRFDENFLVLDSQSFRAFLRDYERYGENERLRGIISLETIRSEEFATALSELNVQFDLVVIDEAHHCRNTSTLAFQLAAQLTDYADAMLLLTATPLQMGNENLFSLLKILSPGEFDNFEIFEQRISPNRYINQAGRYLDQKKPAEALCELRKVEMTSERQRFVDSPYYSEVIRRLSQPQLTTEGIVASKRQLLGLNTLAHIFTRTRKRDVVEHAPERTSRTYSVDFTPAEWKFYQCTIQFVRQQYQATTGTWASGFAVIMRERQAASCISAMREHFEELLKDKYRSAPEDEDTTQWIVPEGYQDELPRSQRDAARALLAAAREVGETDTKFDVFLKALQENFIQDPNSKVIVFSFFKKTLQYLYGRLRGLHYKVRMLHGDIPVLERQSIIDEFRTKPEIQILLSSEVGSEGLDFQFCNTLFNYDLPWNPMKVEQRIGRLDRFGQESPRIKIINFVIQNSIEDRIFMRLYERIGIFQESVGDLEAILGEVIRDLSQAVFTRELSPEEESRLADEAAQIVERRKQELEDFEKRKLEFMGQDAIFASEVKQAIDSGRFISEAEVRALVETYVAKRFPKANLEPNQDQVSFSLVPDAFMDSELRDYILHGPAAERVGQDFLRVLRPGGMIRLTYSADVARERKLVEFITIRHPLARAARQFWESQPRDAVPMAKLVLNSNDLVPGPYYFFIFLFESQGMDRNTTLWPVVISADSNEIQAEFGTSLLKLIQDAPSARADATLFDFSCYRAAQERAKEFAASESDRRTEDLQRSNDAIISARLDALRETYEIKSRTVKGYLDAATELRIRRMRKSQLDRIRATYNIKVQELEAKHQVSLDFRLALTGMALVQPAE